MPPRTLALSLPTRLPPPFLLPRYRHILPTQSQTRGIKMIQPKEHRPTYKKYNRAPHLPTLDAWTEAAHKRKEHSIPLRTGVLAFKYGMSAMYDAETGKRSAVTVLQIERNQVTAHKTKELNGYNAVQVGCGSKKPKNVAKAQLGQFEQAKVPPKRHIAEFRVKTAEGLLPIGTQITPSWYRVGEFVDVKANCKGKGFAGGMKKYGWGGQSASHGASLSHRSMGSAGQSQGGGSRVYPGKRMAGRMGGQSVMVANSRIMAVDEENGLLIINGCVPGPKKGLVKIQDALRKPWPEVDVSMLVAAEETTPAEPVVL